jgi:hypothetical protein
LKKKYDIFLFLIYCLYFWVLILTKTKNIMKIQDIKKDSQFNEITYATVSVSGVAGYSSAVNTHEKNVTKRVKSIKEDTITQYAGTVETFRKFIELEDGTIIRMFWSSVSGLNYASNVYRDAI